jgi:DNA-binding CsgD family transcriptional regulator
MTAPVGELLERDAEVRALAELLDAVAAGDGGLALVQGSAGIGKTTLLRGLRAAAAPQGIRVLSATGAELERDFAFGLVQQLLAPPLRTADPARRAALLSGAAAAAEPVFDLRAAPAPSHATLHGLYWLCAELADETPVLLVVDDAHWGDEPSLRFLEFLARRLDDLPLMLVVAERPGEAAAAAPLLAGLAATPGARTLVLAPLSAEAVGGVMAAALGSEPSHGFVAACVQTTGGNPMLLTELSREMAVRGSVGGDADAAVARSVVPGSLVRSVVARLQRSGPDTLEVARALTVLGERARLDRVARLTGLPPDAVQAAVDGLIRAEVVEAADLRFVHPMIGEAVAADVTAAGHARLHRLAADLLRADGARADVVALHLLAAPPAGDPGAAAVLRRAGDRAAAEGAPELAVRLLGRALQEPPAREDRAAVLLALGTAEMTTGGVADALDHLADVVATGDPATVAQAELARVNLINVQLRHEESAVGIEAALDVLGDTDPALAVRLTEQLLETELYVPTLVGRRVARLEALDPETAPPALLAHLAYHRAVGCGPRTEVVALAQRALATGELLEDFHWGRGTPYWVSEALCLVEARSEVEGFLRDATRAAARSGSSLAVMYVGMCRWHAEVRFGDLRRAAEEARAGLELFQGLGVRLAIDYCLTALAQTLLDQGDLDGADAVLADVPFEREPARFTPVHAVRARLRLTQGRPDEALADLEVHTRKQAEQKARRSAWDHPWATRVATLAALDRGAQALALAEEALTLTREQGVAGEEASVLLARARAEDADSALATLDRAAEVAARSPMRVVRARALTELGAALRRAGQRTAARERLREGRELAHACGAAGVERRAFDELQVAGARPQRIALSGRDALTASELRTAELAAQGLTNRQIAETLFVTRKTVELHLGHAYTKLGIRSRAQLPEALGS